MLMVLPSEPQPLAGSGGCEVGPEGTLGDASLQRGHLNSNWFFSKVRCFFFFKQVKYFIQTPSASCGHCTALSTEKGQ